jgi:DNA-binding response OmpR family regulator
MRLVRELLVADVDPALAEADAAERAARYLGVLSSGLGLRVAAVLLRDPANDRLTCLATSLPQATAALLDEAADAGGVMARRALDERRAFLVRRSTDDPLVHALHEADPAIESIAILPLVDRTPVGVLVLGGDDTTLAADVVRTLTPALRLLALLVSPARGGTAADPAGERRAVDLRAERDLQAETIAELEARIVELEAALASARAVPPREPATPATVAATAADNAQAAEALAVAAAREPAPAATPGNQTIVVIDTSGDWERHTVRDHRLVVAAPGPGTAAQVSAEGPSRIVVNVAAPGGLVQIVDLRAHGVTAPIVGVVAAPGQSRVVGLGIVDAVAHPLTADALVAAVERAAPRGARVFAAGRDAEALMKMRQLLAKQGLSVSMARDTKQIDELLAMVRPQVVVIDLELPMRQGYELVMRMAATSPVPAMVLMAPSGDPSPIFHDKLRDRLGAGQGAGAKQWLADMALQKLPARMAPKTSGTGASAAR